MKHATSAYGLLIPRNPSSLASTETTAPRRANSSRTGEYSMLTFIPSTRSSKLKSPRFPSKYLHSPVPFSGRKANAKDAGYAGGHTLKPHSIIDLPGGGEMPNDSYY